ncbi:hypothetical protein SLEP1_g25399 [Rubroshorea leprosula]|uniref:Uncharacterized protein n=1 Tax=Rubroshorea leprosula TaxID=152421 RepID=A0AAV5JTA9_9ROSI|nr:hypothetical protein SLEP1_g25399 [Rubroshorea leprosula]
MTSHSHMKQFLPKQNGLCQTQSQINQTHHYHKKALPSPQYPTS